MPTYKDAILETFKSDPTLETKDIASIVGCSRRTVRRTLSSIKTELEQTIDEDISMNEAELMATITQRDKTIQKQRDQLRILRKQNRVDDRYSNALESYAEELVSILKKNPPSTKNHTKDAPTQRCEGIVQVSDAHFNELIELDFNTYDFTIAGRRLKRLCEEATKYFKLNDITNIYFVMTGDMVNSDRRLDELLSMATNRTRATILAIELIEQMIIDLNRNFNVRVTYTTGNESRVGKDRTFNDLAVSDNYDTMIYELLKLRFRDCDGVVFIDPDKPNETIIKVNWQNVLVSHGGEYSKESLGKMIRGVKGKYADRGIIVTYVIFGHFHDCSISDGYARSSALCGANAYSDTGLQLNGRASQLIHIVKEDGVDAIKIDLQNTDGVDGYDVTKSLEAYNAKSAKKVVRTKTI